jgi:magnesium-transporting ATPase (P-type)
LTKLLLVHGTWSYQRLSKLILYSYVFHLVYNASLMRVHIQFLQEHCTIYAQVSF